MSHPKEAPALLSVGRVSGANKQTQFLLLSALVHLGLLYAFKDALFIPGSEEKPPHTLTINLIQTTSKVVHSNTETRRATIPEEKTATTTKTAIPSNTIEPIAPEPTVETVTTAPAPIHTEQPAKIKIDWHSVARTQINANAIEQIEQRENNKSNWENNPSDMHGEIPNYLASYNDFLQEEKQPLVMAPKKGKTGIPGLSYNLSETCLLGIETIDQDALNRAIANGYIFSGITLFSCDL